MSMNPHVGNATQQPPQLPCLEEMLIVRLCRRRGLTRDFGEVLANSAAAPVAEAADNQRIGEGGTASSSWRSKLSGAHVRSFLTWSNSEGNDGTRHHAPKGYK